MSGYILTISYTIYQAISHFTYIYTASSSCSPDLSSIATWYPYRRSCGGPLPQQVVFPLVSERDPFGLLDVARGLEAEAAHAGRSLRRRHQGADSLEAGRECAGGLSRSLQQPAHGTKALLDRVPTSTPAEAGGEDRVGPARRGSVR